MPTQHLGTGIDLYYEVHGDGEPLVLIPSTGFGCNVWEQFQIPALSSFFADSFRAANPSFAQFKSLKGQSHGFFWQAPEETNACILDWVLSHR